MSSLRRRRGLFGRLHHPRTTVRWRLTLLYGGLFLACGAALLAITYTLVDHAATTTAPFEGLSVGAGPRSPPGTEFRPAVGQRAVIASVPRTLPPPLVKLLRTPTGQSVILNVRSGQRISDLHQLVIESSVALAIMTLISGALGWLVAGRVLAPLRTMTAATQQMSEANLDERLAISGPPDELRQLADTIDGLLGRLEGAFDAQRRFVANASHELRTPLTTVRALLEMVLSDPEATIATFRTTCRQVLEESEQQEQLIDALLVLAQGQRGIDARERIDLAGVAGDALRARQGDAAARGVHVDATLELAPISGDRRLIERMVSNLVDNALRHNRPGGRAGVVVCARDGDARLEVVNTGPVVPPGEVERLLQPFQRLAGERVGHRDGLGLGLSIVAAIAGAHEAALDVRPGGEGGLEVSVRFARASASDRDMTALADPGAVGMRSAQT
jgi:signal transduction histidine kinase